MRRHRPIMTAMRYGNPGPEFPMPGIPKIQLKPGGLQPLQVSLPLQGAGGGQNSGGAQQTPAAPQAGQRWQPVYQQAYYYGASWLPASSGPQPPGATVWVVWTGGTVGTRRYAGSNVDEPVTITSQIFGGPTGVMVTVVPAPASAYVSNPSVTPIAGPPAAARVPSMHPWSPYWQAGAYEAFGGQKPTCPPGSVLRSDGSNWYCVPSVSNPTRQTNQASHQRPTLGEKAKSILKNVVHMSNPMRHVMGHEISHVSARHANPAPTCDPATCKWVCLPMPTPTDPHDMHCAQVPKNAKLRGAYFTMTPGAPRTFVQRLKDRLIR